MSRVFVSGIGAVSPAGWSVGAMMQALDAGAPLPMQSLERPGWKKPLRAMLVPAPVPRPQFLGAPRLRRTSPITHYAASAALEASASWRAAATPVGEMGLVLCLQSGCVQYSCRFFEEALKDPATASPLLFPETVFAAPASHLATLMGSTRQVCTLVGDPTSFLQGVSLAVEWLEEGRVAACLVVGAEETNWLLADALWRLEHGAVISGGAGAVCLTRDPSLSNGVELSALTPALTYSRRRSRMQAAREMRAKLGAGPEGELLCDGLAHSPRAEAAERAAWRDWTGLRLSPKRVLGEGLMAAAAWQCVAACGRLANGVCESAAVSLVGSNQQAIGARFLRCSS